MEPDVLTCRLRALDEDYAVAVNEAVAEGRDDLVRRLVDAHPAAAAALLAAAGRPRRGGSG